MKVKSPKASENIVDALSTFCSDKPSGSDARGAIQRIYAWQSKLPEVKRHMPIDSNCGNCASPIASSRNIAKPTVQLWFEVESRCNISCKFCYNPWRGDPGLEPLRPTTPEIVRGLRGLLDRVDCEQLSIAGGEPLLRPDLEEILLGIRDYSIPTSLVTNGTLLTPRKISRLTGIGVRSFQVSLHSHREFQHNKLTRRNSWRKSVQAIVWLREAGIQTVPVFVGTKDNMSDFPDFIKFCNLVGVEQVLFNRFVPTGQGATFASELGVPEYEDILSTLSRAAKIARPNGIKITLGVPVEIPKKGDWDFHGIDWISCPVNEGQSRWTIGADLRLRRCSSFSESIGGLFDDGVENLLSDLKLSHQNVINQQFRSCQLLKSTSPVRITRTSRVH